MTHNPPLSVACLVVLVGPPGSGKSTWALRNGRGAIHISQDGLIDAISPHGFEHAYRPLYAAAEDGVARAALRDGHTVIVDRTNRTPRHRERWLTIAHEANIPAVAVEMNVPADVCRARNRSRDDARRLSDDRMERMLANFVPVLPSEPFRAVYRTPVTLPEILSDLSAEEGVA